MATGVENGAFDSPLCMCYLPLPAGLVGLSSYLLACSLESIGIVLSRV